MTKHENKTTLAPPSGHSFHLSWEIAQHLLDRKDTNYCEDIRGSQIINPDDALTFPRVTTRFTSIKSIVMKFGTKIYIPLKIISNNFGDPFTVSCSAIVGFNYKI